MRDAVKTALALAALASAQAVAGDDAGRMAETLRAAYPKTRIKEVNATPVPGLYEVVMGRNVAYVDASGRYFLFGRLFDMQAQKDLTAERIDLATRIDFADLPLADAIVEVRGNGKRKLAVFSDPDCPYCKKLEKELAQIKDATVYTFLYPIGALHPQARERAIAIWCAKNRLAAWKAWMLDGKTPPKPAANCQHPIDRIAAIANGLGIDGTPTLFNASGARLPGLPPTEALMRFVSAPEGAAP